MTASWVVVVLDRWLSWIVSQSNETERRVKSVTTASDSSTPLEKKIFVPSRCRYDWSAEPPLLGSRTRICRAHWQSLLSSLWPCRLHRCKGPVQCFVSEQDCSQILFPKQILNVQDVRNFVAWRYIPLLNISQPWVGLNVLSEKKLTHSDRLSTEGPFGHRSYSSATAPVRIALWNQTSRSTDLSLARSNQKPRLTTGLCVLFLSIGGLRLQRVSAEDWLIWPFRYFQLDCILPSCFSPFHWAHNVASRHWTFLFYFLRE